MRYIQKQHPYFCDTNVFTELSEKVNFESFTESIDRSNSKYTQELLRALQSHNQIREPLMGIEFLGLKSKKINQMIQSKIIPRYPHYQLMLEGSVSIYSKSNKDEADYITLSTGFCSLIDAMYTDVLNILREEGSFSLDILGSVEFLS